MHHFSLTYEQGPIRPPSEAGSLLIRATRNCPWNKCAFCATYKKRKFSRRSIDEIKNDIDIVKQIMDQIISWSLDRGEAGQLTPGLLSEVFANHDASDAFRSVALWLANGGRTVFLQDANSIMLPTQKLVEIIDYIRSAFPDVERITSYARANSLNLKSIEELEILRSHGLNRLHIGMESGSNRVLQLIEKGCTSEQLIQGGKKAVAAGISICLYVIPGIGGRQFSEENARESAAVVNAINPAYVRFRSLYVKSRTPLADMVEQNLFDPPNEDEIVKEIRLFVSLLNGIETKLVSDHVLNLLENVDGTLPHDKEKILAGIDEYLTLPEEHRLLFQLGRRVGGLRQVSEIQSPSVLARLKEAKKQIDAQVPGGIPEYIRSIMRQFI